MATFTDRATAPARTRAAMARAALACTATACVALTLTAAGAAAERAPHPLGTVLAPLSAPATVSAYDGVVAWTSYDPSSGQTSLDVEQAGAIRALATTYGTGGFPGLSVGTAADGSPLILYHGCASGGCGLLQVNVVTGSQALVAHTVGDYVGVVRDGQFAFVRAANGRETLWLGTFDDPGAARELPVLDPIVPGDLHSFKLNPGKIGISELDVLNGRVAYLVHYVAGGYSDAWVLAVDGPGRPPHEVMHIRTGGAAASDRYLLDPLLTPRGVYVFQFGSDGFGIEEQYRGFAGPLRAVGSIGLPEPGETYDPLQVYGAAYDGGHLYYAVAPLQSPPDGCVDQETDNAPVCALHDSGPLTLHPVSGG